MQALALSAPWGYVAPFVQGSATMELCHAASLRFFGHTNPQSFWAILMFPHIRAVWSLCNHRARRLLPPMSFILDRSGGSFRQDASHRGGTLRGNSALHFYHRQGLAQDSSSAPPRKSSACPQGIATVPVVRFRIMLCRLTTEGRDSREKGRTRLGKVGKMEEPWRGARRSHLIVFSVRRESRLTFPTYIGPYLLLLKGSLEIEIKCSLEIAHP